MQSLLLVAGDLFLERGFEAVAVDELIARVGGSRSNIYSHFGSKEGLFRAAMLHRCAAIAEPVEQLRIDGACDPAAALTAFGHALVRTVLSPDTLALHRLLTGEGKRFPDLAQAMWEASYHRVVEILADWIARHQAPAGHLFSAEVPAAVLAEQFVGITTSDVKLRLLVGLVHLPLPDERIDTIVRDAVRTFLHGAAALPSIIREHRS